VFVHFKGDVDLKESSFYLIGKPKITKILFETNKNFVFSDEVPLKVNNNVQIMKNTDAQKTESIVVLSFGVFASETLSDVPFKIDMEIEGHFGWDEKLSQSTQLKDMLRQNAPAILYSYIRPIITLITVEANMPPLVIPLMNFCE
jgi:preprotein translocase subunit SecB